MLFNKDPVRCKYSICNRICIWETFQKHKTLATISKVAAILSIVLFIAANGVLMHFGGWHRGYHNQYNCHDASTDSTILK